MKPEFLVRILRHEAPLKTPLAICYLSDLHFNGRSLQMANDLIRYLKSDIPDLILLGGDYLDTRSGEPHFAKLLSASSALCPTYAIGGNHDRFYGLDRIKELCSSNGAVWLKKEPVIIDVMGTDVCLHGGYVPSFAPPAETLSIVVLHEPVNPERLIGMCHLAFAGHLHGCQFVFWQRGFDLYPGKFFYRNNFLEWRDDKLAYFISRGLGDTLPLRYRCPREVVRVLIYPAATSIK